MSLRELWRRMRFLAGRSRRLAELDEELALHLEMRERQLREEGLSPEEAARTARLQFGNPTRIKEISQDAWGWRWFDGLWTDLRLAARLLRARPLFAATVILTLAVGIGPNAAMFSVMNAVVLRHLPVPEPERLVYLRISGQPQDMDSTGDPRRSFSYAVYARLRQEERVFSDLMAFVPLGLGKTPVRHGRTPEEASTLMVSGNFFTGLGVRAACGRLLTAEDESRHAPVVVLSHAYWSRRFGAACSVVGERIWVKGVPFTIVGVAAEGFGGVDRDVNTDVWVPLQERLDLGPWGMRHDHDYLHMPNWWFMALVGRLATGVTPEAALARLRPTFENAAYAHRGGPKAGEKPPTLSFAGTRGDAGLREGYRDALVVLLAMVALVLVIACGNVALLLVARNATRQREFALRVALGGGRKQLLRQLLAEGLLLVGAAAALGWLFAVGSTHALAAWSELEVDLAPDGRVLLFTLAVSGTAALFFALAPLRGASRAPLREGLRTTTSSGTGHGGWARRWVVALQMTLCLILLVGAGLLVRSLRNLEQIPLGLRASGLLVFGLSPQQRVQSPATTVRFYEDLLHQVRSVPGVLAATVLENRLGSEWSNNTRVLVDGKRPPEETGPARVRWNVIGPDYFRTLEVPLLVGRELRESDGPETAKVGVINETFARRYLPAQNPLGHDISIGDRVDSLRYRIVGVAADSKYTQIREEPQPMAYFSFKQMGHISALFVEVRTAGEPQAFLPAITKAVHTIAPDLPLQQPRTQERLFAMNLADDRLFARLAGFFGLLAVVLVATGLYGTLAYAVNRRTTEIGVRMALGAQRRNVLWMVLRETLLVCGAGVGAGLPLALGAALLMRSSLYGISPADPPTLAASLTGLLAIALAASLLPARRATAVDPMVALRSE